MSFLTHHTMRHSLALSSLEFLLNQALTGDVSAKEQLKLLDGNVIRVRVEKPDDVFFIIFHADGVEVLTEFSGHVSVRVRGELGALLEWLILPNTEPDSAYIKILGPEDTLTLLTDTINRFSLWLVVKQWFDRYAQLEDILAILRREDPRWFKHLSTLPETVERLSQEMAIQRLHHEDLSDEVVQLKRNLRKERQKDIFATVIGILFLWLAVPISQEHLTLHQQFSAAEQAGAVLIIGTGILLSRILFGHRY